MPEKKRKARRKGGGDGESRRGTGPRPFWSGTITFGLVTIPVGLYPANRSQRVSLRMLAPDGTPLRREYYCPEEGRPVPPEALVRGYELDDGEMVVVSDEELEGLAPEKSREIDLRRFVPVDQLDPVFFQRAYFLTPAAESNKAYRLLAETMERTGRAGVATFVMRGKEYLVAILSEGGILRAETMRFHDEVRGSDDVGLPEPESAPEAAVAEMRAAIAGRTRADLEEDELRDRRAERLQALVERKRARGKDVVEAPAESEAAGSGETQVIDLMDVLRRSLAGNGEEGRKPPARAGGREELEELTKEELYERAKALGVPGRSGMNKRELIEAIERTA